MMKILYSGSLDAKSGGPALSIQLTLVGLNSNGIKPECIMPPLSPNGELLHTDSIIHFTKPISSPRIGYMPSIKKKLLSLGKYDIYHIQGIWQYLSHSVASYASKTKSPYIITLHGMLYPQAIKQSKTIKQLALSLYQRKELQNATCIHVTCLEEMKYYRELGFTNPVAVIPNPIIIPNFISKQSNKLPITLGYLGRLHPRKRIERLIYAFNNLKDQTKNCKLFIIGEDDKAYESFLKKEVERLKMKNVYFTGFLTGDEKTKILDKLSYLVLPSDFENFGMVVSEALIRGIPVIASQGTPWEELNTYECGWWIDNSITSLTNAIQDAVSLSQQKRIEMGNRGINLIKNKYSVDIVATKMRQLYEWILQKGEKPDFIHFN